MRIYGVEFTTNLPDMTEAEARRYIAFVSAKIKAPVYSLDVYESDDGKVDIYYEAHGTPFHRLRRITGYLTSDLRSWNDAKQAEERERVKHDA